MLLPGDPGPSFFAATRQNPRYGFDIVAGRYLLLAVVGDGDETFMATIERLLDTHAQRIDGEDLAMFSLLRDADRWSHTEDRLPGARWMLDKDGSATAACGLSGDPTWSGWLLIDPNFRVLATVPAADTERLNQSLPSLPPPAAHASVELLAPVLIVPRVFEPDVCRALIAAYDADGGAASGFMREVAGKTVLVNDASHKIRRDLVLPPGELREGVRARILRRLAPQITKAFQFQVTRMERDLVACYDAADNAFFRAHRDNTTKGTAHRRFAVTINLNAEQYEGGDLRFPEFGSRTYRAPTGGAAVFSCSLLHEALQVTKGKRYAFLPFLYDEAAAQVREENARHVGIEGYRYTAGKPAETAS
ncbi:2OG-Fe(II) oxygenase [Caulobacter sp. FWC2]|uniref:2OG-Fe(II) oxygenase family protein n=1 Tax=Caulobacter sp. FWC2 TaxID=69664 RepID=UPI000C1470C4|nr:2OG-Fe(II) oxygenase [Caulobacter sp. FWC2]PIB90429.1 peroxiredoxin [Caulobacter sp. FWC2]